MSGQGPEYPTVPNEGRFSFDADTLRNCLVELIETSSQGILEDFRKRLKDISLTLSDLGDLLIAGGLIDALGDDYVAYLRRSGVFEEEFILRAKGFYAEVKENFPEALRCLEGTREAEREQMVTLGVTLLPPAKDPLTHFDRQVDWPRIARGEIEPPDSWIKKES